MQFKCTWVNSKLEEEKELILYPSKKGLVADLLEEAKKQVELSENGSGKLRLLEIINYKIFAVQREDMPLDSLANAGTKSFRIEEIPIDELEIADDELLIPVAHFQKEIFSNFGVPFLLKIKHKEPFQKVKERIQKKLEVPDKEFERYKFALIVMGRPQPITDEMDYHINLPDFLPHPQTGISFLQPCSSSAAANLFCWANVHSVFCQCTNIYAFSPVLSRKKKWGNNNHLDIQSPAIFVVGCFCGLCTLSDRNVLGLSYALHFLRFVVFLPPCFFIF
ncbi:ubiquitin carboxyl-terminal hydrolase 7-like isoform X2 [Argiope bruennichi]|uniref:ubiquitinyl hydrolase 1 n=2 Tax=Argiope bruennichi TaxID=94029 RepID=A0A8T0FIN3_ARGBR|nr:ubiquitin carboxyl-terminal hydrolase 7-like isoform X2 [Argiope bruennichi]KAF8789210.1 Ubiquitin carboxyl-terminal hydrolase 7 like protein [Argiope bruennichi]